MLLYVKNKLLHNKWMAVSLLIGNLLLISIAMLSPLYSSAVLQRMLQNDLYTQLTETGSNPGKVEFLSRSDMYSSGSKATEQIEQVEEIATGFAQDISQYVTVSYEVEESYKTEVHALTGEKSTTVRLDSLSDFDSHVTMLTGTLPSHEVTDYTLEGVVSQDTLMNKNLYVGQVLTLDRLTDSQDNPLKLKITGVFEPSSETDAYWAYNPNTQDHTVYIEPDVFEDTLINGDLTFFSFEKMFFVITDYTTFQGEDAEALSQLCDTYTDRMDAVSNSSLKIAFYDTLQNYLDSAARLKITLTVLQVPIFLLLFAFIFMVSGQMIGMDENEIAQIKSRGASRGQILRIYLLQSLIVAVIAYALSVPLSYFLCQVVGSANAFLEFVSRKALPAHFDLSVFLFGFGAAIIGMLAMIVPCLKASRVGIVDYKRSKHRSSRPLWQKMFLDLILLGVSLYGLYSFHQSSSYLGEQVGKGASLDPLLYLCSSMFILGCALLFVRLFPLLVKAVFALFRRFWSPGLYASFLRMLRSRGSQNFIMVFLVITLALGIFSAETARTINQNAEDKIIYQNGADIVVQESWGSLEYTTGEDTTTIYIEPDIHRYDEILNENGASSLARVYVSENASATSGTTTLKEVTLMGISTKEFGETANMKDGLLDDHWYYYLNAISQDPSGILVSTSFRDQLGLKLGDRISYTSGNQTRIRGVIYGFVDYWPTLTPPEAGEDGESYFIIANLSKITSVWGVQPYQIWLKNASSSSQYIYDFAAEKGISFTTFTDTNADIIDLKNDPVFQATNGILTVGFIVVLLLSTVGFLIYWILSIRSRQLQFGIFRAMGMTMGEIIGMLLNEQLYLSVLSMVAGALVGKLTSQLFVPLIQMAYTSADQLIPLTVQNAVSDEIRLYLVVAGVMVVCMLILGRFIKRFNIAQALKLGED